MPTPRKYPTPAARQAAYRARLAEVHSAQVPVPPPRPGSRRWAALLRQACALMARVVNEMETYGAARSEAWQNSERGEEFFDQLAAREELLDLLRDQSAADS